MKKKYKKENVMMVDLHERKNIKIIEAEKRVISDDEMKLFEEQLESRTKAANEFMELYIEKQLEMQPQISKEDFNATMKEMMKQHKILKSLLKEQEN